MTKCKNSSSSSRQHKQKAQEAIAPENKEMKKNNETSGLTGESVDFNSVLSAVSGNIVQDSAATASSAAKDLNLSSIIANIQDEGPAGREDAYPPGKRKPATTLAQAFQQNSQTPMEEEEKAATDAQAEPIRKTPPERRHSQQQAPLPGSDSATAIEKPTPQNGGAIGVSWGSIMARVVITLLMVCLGAMGYLLYQAEREKQQHQAESAKIHQELAGTHELVVNLDKQLQQQKKQMQNLVTPEQMQAQLESQRQNIDTWLQSELRLLQPIQPPANPVVLPQQQEMAPQPESEKPAAAENAARPPSKAIDLEPQALSVTKAAENNVPQATGEGKKSGKWVVHLASRGNRSQAEKTLQRYAKKAPDARIQVASVKGRQVYRVSVFGFASKKEALAYQKEISRELGLKGVWIAK